MEDFKLCLQDTDYVSVQQNTQIIKPQEINRCCFTKFVKEFEWFRAQATGQLAYFIDLISYEYQIANVIEIIAATVKGTPAAEVIEYMHPLGHSPYINTMLTFEKEDNLLDLYTVVLVDMPIAKYFAQYFENITRSGQPSKALQGTFTEVDVNVIFAHLRKIWLEDIYAFCSTLGGETWDKMKDVLEFEADRHAIEIVHNSIAVKSTLNDPINRLKRQELFCSFGKLYPDCTCQIDSSIALNSLTRNFSKINNDSSLYNALDVYPIYYEAMHKSQERIMSLSDALKYAEVDLLKSNFDGQCQISIFYAYVKLKLIELENIRSISSAVSFRNRSMYDAKKQVVKYIPIF